MKKGIFFVFFLFLFAFQSVAEITDADKNLKPEPFKGGKDAIVILRKVVVDDTYTKKESKEEYYVKFKVFTKKGIDDLKNVKIYYNPKKEKIEDLKAIVWSPDGKIYKLKDADIVKKDVAKKWGEKVVEISFAFPSLVEGSVVEYSFSKIKDYIREINRFYSQGEVYTKRCELKFIAPSYMTWGYTGDNLHQRPKITEDKQKDKKIVNIVFTDIPGLPKEDYSYPYSSLREQIIFYYTSYMLNPGYYWQETATNFFDYQGRKFLKANRTIKKILKNEIGVQGKTNEQILKDIYDYVVTHYKSIYMLSKSERENLTKKYLKKVTKADIKVKKIVNLPYLTELQIDLLTLCFIKNAIPDAKISIGLYVPWDSGKFLRTMRTLSQFEEWLLKVEVGGKSYYLAPGKGMLPFGYIPYGARNTEIYFISENGASFEKIKDMPADKAVSESVMDVTLGDEKMTVKATETLNFYESYNLKSYALFLNDKQIREIFEQTIQEQFGDDAKLIDFKLKNLKVYNKPLIVEYSFSYPYEFEELGDNLIFKPLLFPRYDENPFAVDKRYSPIIFKYPEQQKCEITYHLPEDIEINTLPEAKTVSRLGFSYKTEYSKLDSKTFKVKVFQQNKYSVYPKTAVWQFKTLFDELLAASNPKVVLREIE
ncbi:conserved hypothetical protein [Thermotomaculum hydrothermale]|uniref:DUF3857 domain-containing protein n=1 Tax=Thermotomaculum hydrothermale TaxID=981385 RepID=A0A7R6PIR4_9BACT|nr:DUF3857 domain-containing protein [Thermotomaculum hydrothermale]BBB33354.1 conserved hypothetical protein [Thermotomaculum hydrothermale]